MAAACRPAWRTSLLTSRPCRPLTHSKAHTRNLWTSRTSHPSSRVQVYISHSHDPYLNLSAEHLLLQRSHPDSTVLLLYANDPCVVIGRNQNPWVEVSLGLLRRYRPAHDSASSPADKAETGHSSSVDSVALVRRRSGGGTVFHDHGNVNFSVICPSAVFDRDRHAEMVVRALRRLGIPTAHVNARHDIVVDDDASHSSEQHQQQTFKVSGSAYKLTRLRSLHHGTCLLSSPNLAGIGRLLRSPAEPFIKTRGVESVRSRIRNLGLAREDFVGAVTDEFARMYGAPDVQMAIGGDVSGQDFYADEIQRGYRELTVSLNLTFLTVEMVADNLVQVS